MSEVIIAKNAGFCFGVNQAVNLAFNLIDEGRKVCTLGPIIHNEQIVTELKEKGARIVESPDEVQSDEILIIRSHGVTKSVYETAAHFGVSIVDATCPFVAKIHRIVEKASKDGRTILIAGDENHKEVEGIMGHTVGKCFVFSDEYQLEKLLNDGKISRDELISVVSQTTFNNNLWLNCQKNLKKVYTNAIIFDTICNATADRQLEADSLSRTCDAMVIIGGKHSSNTVKLYDVCKQNCNRTVLIETVKELNFQDIIFADKIGVAAGASTPARIIKEVLSTMSEMLNTENNEVVDEKSFDEMSFEEMLDASLNSYNTDKKVQGIVISVNQTEIQVDIGRKHTGFIPAHEFSNDSSVKLTDVVKIGDTLDLIIMRTNDQEGTVMLSKRRFDSIAGLDKVSAAKDNDEVLTAVVTDIIKGGVVAFFEGVRVFIPASHATLTRNESIDELKGKEISFRIIEIGRGRRVIGSVRAVLREKNKEILEKFWSSTAIGDKITGKVKSLTGYGAFVDLGGVDGMVHISELSWTRIKNPSEVLSVGDEVEVYIKALDVENKKISLGYKKADENPWELFSAKYDVGDVVKVKIVSMTAYGAFARIIPGVDGLIHISQISDRRIDKPQDELKLGDEVDAKIIEIEFDKKRISLSIKALIASENEDKATEEAIELVSDEAAK